MSDSPLILDSLAVVVPRFGPDLGGGAETLVRSLALALLESKRVRRVEAWTTCAADHRTWENALPSGESWDQGILVRRFPVDPRDLEVFIAAEHALANGQGLNIEQQLGWLSNSVNSRALYAHIAQNSKDFQLMLFAPYLFATTFWGSQIDPQRSVLIPCLHDEAYAYLDVFRFICQRVRGIMFNALPEAELAERLYDLNAARVPWVEVGMGFASPADTVDSAEIVSGPYLLYSGRKETGKNLHLLIEYYLAFRARFPDTALRLVLIGSGEINFLSELPAGVIDLGFVTEAQKRNLMRNAVALSQPSTNESFSIVLMECWQESTPVIVHASCAVTKAHAIESGGGLYFANAEEFIAIVRTLLSNKDLARELGASGARYVRRKYNWSAVVDRFIGGVEDFKLTTAPHSEESPADFALSEI